MTEEIIIDGVNVKKCDFFHPEYGRDCHIALAFDYHNDKGTYYGCDQNLNCYYKQLQRLKQKNEKLKGIVKDQCHKCRIGDTTEDNYRKALEEIRENLVKLKTNDEDDFTYEYSKIEDKINEVLR